MKKQSQLLIIIFFILFLLNYTTTFSFNHKSNYFDCIQNAVGRTSINDASIIQNPARLINFKNISLSFDISPSKFEMPELTPTLLFVGANINEDFSFAASLFGIGNNLYKEYSAAAHSAYRITNTFSIGASFEYSTIHIEKFKNSNLFTFDLGVLLDISENITAGACLKNVACSYYDGGDKSVNQVALVGFGFTPYDNFNIDVDGVIRTYTNSGLSIAGSYNFNDIVYIRIGAANAPKSLSTGLSINPFNYLKMHIILNYFESLGFCQQYGLSVVL